MRVVYLIAGLTCVGFGWIGLIVPGLPGTVFFICAAGFFARSNRRLERWVLDLPGVGQLVRDYRSGLGMPRRAKQLAIGSIVAACTFSAGFALDPVWLRVVVAATGLVGVWYVGFRVPTRESVLAARAGATEPIGT